MFSSLVLMKFAMTLMRKKNMILMSYLKRIKYKHDNQMHEEWKHIEGEPLFTKRSNI
jgi:hypothetical protein